MTPTPTPDPQPVDAWQVWAEKGRARDEAKQARKDARRVLWQAFRPRTPAGSGRATLERHAGQSPSGTAAEGAKRFPGRNRSQAVAGLVALGLLALAFDVGRTVEHTKSQTPAPATTSAVTSCLISQTDITAVTTVEGPGAGDFCTTFANGGPTRIQARNIPTGDIQICRYRIDPLTLTVYDDSAHDGNGVDQQLCSNLAKVGQTAN